MQPNVIDLGDPPQPLFLVPIAIAVIACCCVLAAVGGIPAISTSFKDLLAATDVPSASSGVSGASGRLAAGNAVSPATPGSALSGEQPNEQESDLTPGSERTRELSDGAPTNAPSAAVATAGDPAPVQQVGAGAPRDQALVADGAYNPMVNMRPVSGDGNYFIEVDYIADRKLDPDEDWIFDTETDWKRITLETTLGNNGGPPTAVWAKSIAAVDQDGERYDPVPMPDARSALAGSIIAANKTINRTVIFDIPVSTRGVVFELCLYRPHPCDEPLRRRIF